MALPTEDTYIATVIHEQEPEGEEGGLSDSVFLGRAVGLVKAVLAVSPSPAHVEACRPVGSC